MTYTLAHCPCCGRTDLESRDALIAPFIRDYVLEPFPLGVKQAERTRKARARYLDALPDRQSDSTLAGSALGRPRGRCRLARCRSCDAMFFDERFTPEEIARLYDGYRGPVYFAARHGWEPWYTRKFNDKIGGDREIEQRKAVYHRAIGPWLTKDIVTVLDYAGDSGQLMPDGPGKEYFLYDISGVEPIEGVTLIGTEVELTGNTFDLVLMCHILEHFSEPLEEVMAVASLVRPGGLLYVEVPLERFPIADIPTGAIYRRYLDLLSRSRLVCILADFWSTAIRVKFGRIAPMAFVKMHEHLNYFNEPSLRRLLEATGLEVLSCSAPDEMNVVISVCRRPHPTMGGSN